jgi:hypothetical protein
MKKSKMFLLGTLIIGMAFSLVLAGCSTTGNNSPTAEELAEQLTEDINDIEAGKAVMDGDTVMLTGGVRLENAALTVPPGVTLDLTKETLQLANNAIFTVNGTVNAKAEGINIDSVAASPAAINGNGTISLKSKGLMFGIYEGKKLTLDGVTLVGLSDNDNSLVRITNGGELVMKSGAITGNTHIVTGEWAEGGGVRVGGTFIMEGGEISGNCATGIVGGTGGGVRMWDGTFTMKGGVISGNSARAGGGVSVGGANATFTMEGGRIQGSDDSDGFTKNTADAGSAALNVRGSMAKWGTGGTYTKGGEPQAGGSEIIDGSDIGGTDDTLIAIPAP